MDTFQNSRIKEKTTMRTVGERFPNYELPACVGLQAGAELATVKDADHAGKWRVVFFWPMDFTFVCPTEIAEFGRRHEEFAALGAVVLGASTDSQWVHLAWRRSHPELRNLPFPMLADHKRELSTELGILHPEDGVPLRATYIVDPEGVIRFVSVNDLSVGRSVGEVLRVLAALQTGELCPAEWRPGEGHVYAA
jgi:peroxiredoxin (alkyl hydroperoxide reductase subunit C)